MQTYIRTFCYSLSLFLPLPLFLLLPRRTKLKRNEKKQKMLTYFRLLFVFVTISFFHCPSFLCYPEGQSSRGMRRSRRCRLISVYYLSLSLSLSSTVPLSSLTQLDKVEEEWEEIEDADLFLYTLSLSLSSSAPHSPLISVYSLSCTLSFFRCPSFLSYLEGQSWRGMRRSRRWDLFPYTLCHSLFLCLSLFPLLPRRTKLKRNEKKQKMRLISVLSATLSFSFFLCPSFPLTQKDKVEEEWEEAEDADLFLYFLPLSLSLSSSAPHSPLISVSSLSCTLSFFLCPSFLSYPGE